MDGWFAWSDSGHKLIIYLIFILYVIHSQRSNKKTQYIITVYKTYEDSCILIASLFDKPLENSTQ